MSATIPVTFAPAGPTVRVEAGVTLAQAAEQAGVLLAAPCAGRGICGGCGVRVIAGELDAPDAVEAAALRRAPQGVRLACRARVIAAVEVQPLFASATASPAIPAQARAAGGHPECVAVGIDLGTTSVAALVVDAQTGEALGSASVPNRQRVHGADVLSRLSAAHDGRGEELQALAVASVGEALDRAMGEAGAGRDRIARVAIAGNSAMAALLQGADASSLEAFPFEPPVRGGALVASARAQLGLPAECEAWLIAPIASFVGGDALAASMASGLVDVDRPTLLIDVGTNAELVLAVPGAMYATSTAAGPAFEGVGISCGGPASAEAVARVAIANGAVCLETIGGGDPAWLSGAGLVSAIAALRGAGHLAADGRLQRQGPLAARFSADAAGVLGVDLSPNGDGSLVLSQLDVRALQLAKAAVRVGLEALLGAASLAAAEVDRVLVAGAFGAALEPDDLVTVGMLPAVMRPHARRVGNAALEGAATIALDPALEMIAESAAKGAVHVDLAQDAQFGPAFLRATALEPFDE